MNKFKKMNIFNVKNDFKDMTDDYLQRNYVPAVYQRNIYAIDYQKLKEAGVKLISFDIDDTIAALAADEPPKAAITLFANLKNMGFELMLLSNARDSRASYFAEKLGIKGCYIARADKPDTKHFQIMQDQCGVEKNQMAHVGNSIQEDVAGGNSFGIITCMVRRIGKIGALPNFNPLVPTQSQLLREELKERGIWFKHHVLVPDDQYYQLGELPKYKQSQNISKTADKEDEEDPTFSEIMLYNFKNHENDGMETLRAHLGEDIVFTATGDKAMTGRNLEDPELSGGEIYGCIFTISCYTVRLSMCAYRDDDSVQYYQEMPAEADIIAEYRRAYQVKQSIREEYGVRPVMVVSAKYKDMPDWQKICIATVDYRWSEIINFISALKYDASEPDENEMLFVLKAMIDDSLGETWYKLSSDGNVTKYGEDPYDSESRKESWR